MDSICLISLELRQQVLLVMLHRGERVASARASEQDNPRDAHRGEFPGLLEGQLASEPLADRYFQRRGAIGGAFVLTKPSDHPARLRHVFRDSEFERPFEACQKIRAIPRSGALNR